MNKIMAILMMIALSGINLIAEENDKEKKFSLGLILGEPTGICGKLWTSQKNAIDGAAAWTIAKESAFHFHMDYLWHDAELIKENNFISYYGIGARIKFENNARVGMRIPVGIDYFIEKTSLDAFFEVVPIIDLIPGTYVGINVGIGIRFAF